MFTGGIDLPEEKQATLDELIVPAGGVERLLVPLAPCGGAAARPTVNEGQSVEAGQKIATAAADGVDIFAPLGGVVRSITSADTAVGRDLLHTPAVELADLTGQWTLGHAEATFDWRAAEPRVLRERIRDGRLATFRPRPQPLAKWLKDAYSVDCRLLVVNAMENQPYMTGDHRLLVEFGQDVLAGLAILARAADIAECILAVDARRTGDYQHLLTAGPEYAVQPVALPHKYPVGADNILLKVLTGREVPWGGRAGDIGSAVIDAATCFAVYRWVVCGRRLNGRVVTVSGERAARPANLFAPFGCECRTLLGDTRRSFVLGGPMTGLICDAPGVISPAVGAILGIDPTPSGYPAQCIRCGWCRDHCPARLNVAMLNDMYELGQVASARQAGALACVECGVCSYVCPARLPLTERVRQLKQIIRRMQPDRQNAQLEDA